jgi:hypothetical protein
MINMINRSMNAGAQPVVRAQDPVLMSGGAQIAQPSDSFQLSQTRPEPVMTANEMRLLSKIKRHEFTKSFVSCDEDKAVICGSLGVTGGMGAAAIGGVMTNSLPMAGALFGASIALIWGVWSAVKGSENSKHAEQEYAKFFMANREAESINKAMEKYPELAYSVQV